MPPEQAYWNITKTMMRYIHHLLIEVSATQLLLSSYDKEVRGHLQKLRAEVREWPELRKLEQGIDHLDDPASNEEILDALADFKGPVQ